MDFGLKVAIEHEQEVIDSAKNILKTIKTLHSAKESVQDAYDYCSDELNKIIGSTELFLKFLHKK